MGKSQWQRGKRDIARGEGNEAKSKIQRGGCKRQKAMGKVSKTKSKRERVRGKGKETKYKRQRVRQEALLKKGKT